MTLNPKHIVITGAAGAIGGALVARCAERYPAARLTLVDVNVDAARKLATTLGDRAQAVMWDLTQPQLLDAHWQKTVGFGGPVDMLVNCAGIMEIRNFHSTPWKLAEALMMIDLMSPLKLMHLAMNAMAQAGGGTVVNVSSMAGRVPIKGCTFYGAAKSGLAMASEIAHVEYRTKNIHVLTVYPGPVHSGLESHARGQVKQGVISKLIPTGEPGPLAKRIVNAMERRTARVVYPDVYGIANRFIGLSSFVTARISPEPNS